QQELHGAGAGGYVVAKWAIVHTLGSGIAPYWNGYTAWGGADVVRDIVLVNPTNPVAQAQPASQAATAAYDAAVNAGGGVVLDGWGGVHVFGGAQVDIRGYAF